MASITCMILYVLALGWKCSGILKEALEVWMSILIWRYPVFNTNTNLHLLPIVLAWCLMALIETEHCTKLLRFTFLVKDDFLWSFIELMISTSEIHWQEDEQESLWEDLATKHSSYCNLSQMIWNILDWMMTSERFGLISSTAHHFESPRFSGVIPKSPKRKPQSARLKFRGAQGEIGQL